MSIQLRCAGERKLIDVQFEKYPNGEYLIKNIDTRNVPFDLIVKYKSMEEFHAALHLADAIKNRKARTCMDLIIPFIPGARQDRITEGNFLFNAKSIAAEINLRQFEKVITLDPHSPVITGMINNCFDITPRQVIKEYLSNPGWDFIISPDRGAYSRAHGVARAFNLPIIYAWKSRDIATGLLDGFGCWEIPDGSRALIVDDICDGGGTFVGLAEYIAAKHRGVKLDLYVSHGFFTKGTETLLKFFNNIYTTNSIDFDRDTSKVKVINIDHLLGIYG